MIEDGVQISCEPCKGSSRYFCSPSRKSLIKPKDSHGLPHVHKKTKEEFQETLPNRSHTNRCFLTAEQLTGRWDMHLKIFFLSGVLYFDNYSNLIY